MRAREVGGWGGEAAALVKRYVAPAVGPGGAQGAAVAVVRDGRSTTSTSGRATRRATP
jgi:hypothetical protein